MRMIACWSRMSVLLPRIWSPHATIVVALGLERQIVGFRQPTCAAFAQQPMEAAMERFIHDANIDLYRHLIAQSERDPHRDEDRHKTLLTLLAEEKAKDQKPL